MALQSPARTVRLSLFAPSLQKHLLPTLPVSAKKPWISSFTLDLITQFQDCTDLTVPEIKSLRKRIKKSASRDKKQFIAQHLQEDFHGSSINQWRTARSIRKPFTPRSVNLFNIHGKLSSKDLRATTLAEYLSEKVWNSFSIGLRPKAFDSVTFSAIESSLRFFGVPPLFIDSIQSLYRSPKFQVRDAGKTSGVYSQTRGLRQRLPSFSVSL